MPFLSSFMRSQCLCFSSLFSLTHLWSSLTAISFAFVIHFVGFFTNASPTLSVHHKPNAHWSQSTVTTPSMSCLLYTSDAADE